MTIAAGTRLGPYEILAPLGAGGMGEVYRARDTRLDRIVAIKVLPVMLARDPEFRARFEREAKSISALNHPHICTLHDVGRQDDVEYLVMEHLEGESLAARLTKGPIPADEALGYAVQIADALDKAHRQGIVHRDLKPGNIFLLKAGSASGPGICKLLDFGLAKIGPLTSSGVIETKLATSPPAGAPLTARGSILGTFQYMAPEQIEGQDSDARTDIWAFGCVLYEMLTGRRAFEGKSQASLIASILERQPPPIAELQPMTPPALGRIVRTCLEKNPDNRFHTAHDLCLQLRWIEEGGSAAGLPAPVIAGRKRNERAIFAAALLTAVILAAAGVWSLRPAPPPANVVTYFSSPLPEGQQFTRGGRRVIAISPDGSQLAYIANEQIYLRRMHELVAQPIRGTTIDPVDLAFSPDGESIAFFTPQTARGSLDGGILRKIAVTGGVPVTLATGLRAPWGTRWQGDTIVFATGRTIESVPDTGGPPTQLLALAEGTGEQIAQPQLVKGGRELLYSVRKTGGLWDDGQIVAQPIGGGERRVLVHGGTDGRLSPTGDRLFYVRDATLFVQPLDPKTLSPSAGPTPVMEGVRQQNATGGGQWDTSNSGTLVFARGGDQGGSALVWVDRRGQEEAIPAPSHRYSHPRISPDGTKIAVDARDEDSDIWVWDEVRKTLSKLTFGPDIDAYPVWAPDSRTVIFRSNPSGQTDLFQRAVDGTGTLVQLTKSEAPETPQAVVGQDGLSLLIRFATARGGDQALALVALRGDAAVKRLMPAPSSQYQGEVSPDGKWIAYQSAESSTQDEIYVRPFPDVERGRWQISTAGGRNPVWSRSGRELFFHPLRQSRIHVVAVSPARDGAFTHTAPEPIPIDTTGYALGVFGRAFDISPDGRRFLVVKPDAVETLSEIVVASHWFDELARRTSAPKR